MIAEWSETIKSYWFGDWREFIAWHGSHQIFVFPTDDYPNPPTYMIQHDKRIESVEEFEKALENGKWLKVAISEDTEER